MCPILLSKTADQEKGNLDRLVGIATIQIHELQIEGIKTTTIITRRKKTEVIDMRARAAEDQGIKYFSSIFSSPDSYKYYCSLDLQKARKKKEEAKEILLVLQTPVVIEKILH